MDGMLAGMTPRQLSEWRAFIDGCGETDDWQQSGINTAAIVNEVRRAMAGFSGQKLRKDEIAQATDYMPGMAVKKLRRRQSSTEIMRALNG